MHDIKLLKTVNDLSYECLLCAFIVRALCKVVGNQAQMWDEYLDAVMFGLRTKKQVTTKYSPYYLMFGREARYPSEIPEEFMVCLFVCDKLHGNPTQRNFFSF